MPEPALVRTDFVQVTLVDPRGRVLMQERDEHAPVWPEMWCFPGGGVDDGESPVDAAVRELAEETGVLLAAEDLTDLGRFELVTADRGTFHFHAFVARTTLSEVECHEGRQMVFVGSDPMPDVDLVPSTALVAPRLSAWIEEHPFVPSADQHRFAGVILVDRHGRIPLDGDLRHPPACRSEPALAHQSVTVSPGSIARTSQPEISFLHASGVPVRSGNVPQWHGIIFLVPRSSVAAAASSGPMVKWSPIGRIATSGLYRRAIRLMSPKTQVSPAK